MPKVEGPMPAYRTWKDRLDRVKETLGQYLQPESTPVIADTANSDRNEAV